jgi:hypothetical protein
VYLDSLLPETGKSLDDYLPAPLPSVDGRIKPLDLRAAFGISREPDVAWAGPRLSDHPARADSQPVDLSRNVNLRQTYIRCSNNFPFFVESAERAKRQGFRFYELMSANHCPIERELALIRRIWAKAMMD